MFLNLIDMDQKFLILDEKQFLEIKEDIKTIIKFLEKQGKSPQKKYFNTITTSEYLNCAVRTVYHYIKKGFLNPKKIGGKLLFDPEEIETLIEGKK